MLALLKNRALLVALGLVLLAVMLWFFGPYFAFADYKPLESVVARLLAILFLAVAYAAYVQLRHMRSALDTLELSPLHESMLWDYLEHAAHAMVNSA